jgi:hypothetical protein
MLSAIIGSLWVVLVNPSETALKQAATTERTAVAFVRACRAYTYLRARSQLASLLPRNDKDNHAPNTSTISGGP